MLQMRYLKNKMLYHLKHDIEYSSKKSTDYENFSAECPYCKYYNIFNRATNFGNFDKIDFKKVKCENLKCNRYFYINGDLINPAFQMFLIECNNLLKLKKYMNCISNICQAYESFFSLFLYKIFVFDLFNHDSIDQFEETYNKLTKKIKDYTYKDLRNLFINIIIGNMFPKSFKESLVQIDHFNQYKNDPNDKRFLSNPNLKYSKELIILKKSKINEIRNNVLHKNAYRPTLNEVLQLKEEAEKLLAKFSAQFILLTDDIKYYLNTKLPYARLKAD